MPTSNRPYLIRAIYDWLIDNQLTPHLLVDANAPDTVVPKQYAQEDGFILLNIAPSAIRDIYLGNDFIRFNTRFNGRAMEIFIPPQSVRGIYARENNLGMIFADEAAPSPSSESSSERAAPSERAAHLTTVATTATDADVATDAATDADAESAAPPAHGESAPPKGRPTLRIIK